MLDKQTWRASAVRHRASPAATTAFEIRYSIEWDDPGPFNSQLNDHHAFMNLAEILMYVPDRRAEDTQVAFHDVPAGWKPRPQLAAASASAIRYMAPSYDALVDAPVEAGKFEEFEFDKRRRAFSRGRRRSTAGTRAASKTRCAESRPTNFS